MNMDFARETSRQQSVYVTQAMKESNVHTVSSYCIIGRTVKTALVLRLTLIRLI